MKNKLVLNKSLLLMPLILLTLSCSKSYIEKTPISTLVTSNFYKNASDAEAGLAGTYSSLQNEFYIWDFETNGDVRADNCYAGGNNPDNFALDNFTQTPTNGNATRDWQHLYRSISTANVVLDNVPNITDASLSDGRKAQILGEAKFLRALHYSFLVTLWGDVPLVLSLNNDFYPPRAPAAEVYAQIVKDLQEAEAVLPVTAADAGRATQGAAQALLAKVYAQEGNYQSCLDECNKVLPPNFGGSGTGGYDLVSDYEFLWDDNHRNNVESIFEIQHNSENGFGNWGIELYLPYSITGDTWVKFNNPTTELINTFRNEGDSIRLNSSVYFENTVATSSTPPPFTSATQPVPFSNKWRITNGYNWDGNCNTILLRLADIILLKAEALNQTGQTADAIPLVNAIRTRVSLPDITVTSQTDVAAAILKERRLELAFEGQRWNDLLRFGTQFTITLLNNQTDPLGNPLNYNLTAEKILLPVPQTERDLDKNLSQNPGY
jgi:hypothetical protein